MSDQSTYGIGLPVWVTITPPVGDAWPQAHRWRFDVDVDLTETGVAIREVAGEPDQDPPPDDKTQAAIERFIEATSGKLAWSQTVFVPDQPPRPPGDPNRFAENYPRAVELAADGQGITRIVEAWREAGLEALSEQTGGFTMVATIYGKAGIIQANDEGFTVTYTTLDRYNADEHEHALVMTGESLQDMVTFARVMVAIDRVLTAHANGDLWDAGDSDIWNTQVAALGAAVGLRSMDDLVEAMEKEPLQ